MEPFAKTDNLCQSLPLDTILKKNVHEMFMRRADVDFRECIHMDISANILYKFD